MSVRALASRMARIVLAFLLMLPIPVTPEQGQPKDWLIVYGNGFTFGVKAPEGWLGDWEKASALKSNIILYPKGHDLHTAYGIIRVRVNKKRDENTAEALAADMEGYRQKFPGIEFLDVQATHPHYQCFPKLFLLEGKFHEYVAYVNPGPAHWYMFSVAMNTRDSPAKDPELEAFRTVAGSLLAMDTAQETTAFEAALKAADENLASKKGEKYDTDFARKAGPWLATALSRCTKGLPDSELIFFTVLVRVGAEGKAEEVLAQPPTKVALCLKPLFAAAKNPKPPGPSWWVKMEIMIK
jgi:hypothetical protein